MNRKFETLNSPQVLVEACSGQNVLTIELVNVVCALGEETAYGFNCATNLLVEFYF